MDKFAAIDSRQPSSHVWRLLGYADGEEIHECRRCGMTVDTENESVGACPESPRG